MSRTFKTKNDPSYKTPTVEVIVDNGVIIVIQKDEGVRLVINSTVLPSYEVIRKK